MAAVAWAPRIDPTTGDQLAAIMDQHAVAGWGATSAFVTAPGRTFQQKWQDTMAAYQAAHAARVAGGAAGVSDDESDQITRLVLLLKQLGIYNGVLLRHAEYGAAANPITGAVLAGGVITQPDIVGGVAGGAANNPMSANEIAQIVDHSLECWFHGGPGACNNFVNDVKVYINNKLAKHPSATDPALRRNIVNAYLNLHNITSGAPAIAVLGAADDPTAIDVARQAAALAANPFDLPAVAAFGGKPKKASKKAKKVAKKAAKKATRKSAKKAAKKPAKKATRKSVKKAAKKGKKATRKH